MLTRTFTYIQIIIYGIMLLVYMTLTLYNIVAYIFHIHMYVAGNTSIYVLVVIEMLIP